MNILSNLTKLKSAADFSAAITDLEREHAAALAAVADLESQREDLIFSGGDLVKLEADISAAEGRAKTLAVAMEGARTRRDAAAEAEAQAELEAVASDARKLNVKLRAQLIDFGKVAETLASHAEKIKGLREQITVANIRVRTCGRSDLVISDPWKELPEIVGRVVGDPMRNLHIEEFWPRHRKGPALLKLTK